MHYSGIALVLSFTVALTSCMKDQQEVAQDVGLLPSGCGSDGARLEASVDGVGYCANMQLLATGSDGSVIVTGVDLEGNTLVLQFDELAVGAHVISEASNGALYMQLGLTYIVAPGTEGQLIITTHDPEAHRLKASFDVPLFNETNGVTRVVSGDLDVVYSVEE